MNRDERFYCPTCLVPVEFSPELKKYICEGTCDKKIYRFSEIIPCDRLTDSHILNKNKNDR